MTVSSRSSGGGLRRGAREGGVIRGISLGALRCEGDLPLGCVALWGALW
jgi:hypothetical protein